MRVLALCGSLRAASLNALLLRATARLIPQGMELERFELGDLPLFNPDLEGNPPQRARELEAALARADALLIATPEYAHGVTGTIKNALDWLVGGAAFPGKPIALFDAAPRSRHAQAALREILRTMSGRVTEAACLQMPLLGTPMDEDALVSNGEISAGIRSAMAALRAAVEAARVGHTDPEVPQRALLIIDMQQALVAGAWQSDAVVARIAALAARARSTGTPVLYVQHDHASFAPMRRGEPGWQIDARLAPVAGDTVFSKTASDAFHRTDLASMLAALGVTELLICGMQSEYCVDATARAALNQELDVILVGDCHTTGDASLGAEAIIRHHNETLVNLAHPTGRIRCRKERDLLFSAAPL